MIQNVNLSYLLKKCPFRIEIRNEAKEQKFKELIWREKNRKI